ncbi:hypothetical protein DYI26_21760 [Halomonas litopenaei]|nr:hypothetical protein [Halomonas litopenaei]
MDTCFDGRTCHYRYDDGGALIELREGELVTTFTRDAMGRMLERERRDPMGQPAPTTRYVESPLWCQFRQGVLRSIRSLRAKLSNLGGHT